MSSMLSCKSLRTCDAASTRLQPVQLSGARPLLHLRNPTPPGTSYTPQAFEGTEDFWVRHEKTKNSVYGRINKSQTKKR